MKIIDLLESPQMCSECGGPAFSDLLLAEKKDACYSKVRSRYKVWPSAYASGALVQCRKKGAANWGNKNESQEQLNEKCWDGYEQQGMKNKGGRQVPNCVPAESVNEMDKSQTPPGRDGSNDSDAAKKEYTATPTTPGAVARQGGDILNKAFKDSQRVDPRTGKKMNTKGVAETMATFSAKASTSNSGSGEFRGVSIPSDMKHPEWREPTWSFQEIAQKLGIPVATLNLLAFNRIGGFPEALSGLSARHGSKKYYKQSEVKRWVNANNVREKLKQGVAEGQLDEKSTSQAQFRTMAAAAHNPEFAKKVGIKQSVAREFNQADKGSNYKKLPDRTTEGEVEKTKTGIIHRSSSAYGGGEAPRAPYDPGKYAKDIDHLDKDLTSKLDKSMGIKWPHGNKQSGMDEGEQQKGADYRDPPEADYGADYQDMVSRVKKLAGLGPLKTVYDPQKRVYRNVPTAVQPKK
jgi:hypothetical protein